MGRNTQIYYDAAEAISKLNPGSEIPHEVMATLVKVSHSSGAYHGRVDEVKTILRTEYKIFLKSIIRKGYEIVLPDAAIGECENTFYQGYRGMIRGVVNGQYVNIDAIKTSDARAKTIEKQQKMAALVGLIRNSLTKSERERAGEPKTLKDVAKSVGRIKESQLPNGGALGAMIKQSQKATSGLTSKN